MSVRMTALGGAQEIGRSCYLYEFSCGTRIVIDCGMKQGEDFTNEIPALEALNGKGVDAIIFTHSHLDHIGAAPVIARKFPNAELIATPPTWHCARIMLQDAYKVQELNHAPEVLSGDDLVDFTRRLSVEETTGWFRIGGVEVRLLPAGHLRGAASILMRSNGTSALHTGDVSFVDTPTVSGAWPLPRDFAPDLMVIEATYGTESVPSRQEVERDLIVNVRRVLERGGNILIPAFANGRSQDVILALLAAGIRPWTGGLAARVIKSMLFEADNKWVSDNDFGALQRAEPLPCFGDAEEEIVQGSGQGQVVVAPSGWIMGGWSQFFATRWADDERNAIFLTGYQMPGYPSDRLLRAPHGATVPLGDTAVVKRAEMKNFRFAGHCTAEDTTRLLDDHKPALTALVHGEEPGLGDLREHLQSRGHRVIAPANLETVSLD